MIRLAAILLLIAFAFSVKASSAKQNKKEFSRNQSASEVSILDSIIFEKYDTLTSQWKIYKRSIYAYDQDGNKIEMLRYTWQQSRSNWEMLKDEYLYDLNANLTEQTEYSWDTISGQWMNNTRWINAYDNEGILDTTTIVRWDPSDEKWINSFRNVYTLDGKGNIYEMISYNWNNSLSQWEYQYKYETVYDTCDRQILSLTYKVDKTVTQWINYSRSEWEECDTEGNYLKCNYFDWDTAMDQWLISIKYSYTYNSGGKIICQIGSVYNETTELWEESSKYEYKYNGVGNETLFTISFWNESQAQWIGSSKRTSYYLASPSTGITNSENPNLIWYPVPAKDFIKIEMKGMYNTVMVELFDLNGRKVISQDLNFDNRISAGQLKNGVYLIRISCDNNVFSEKIVIRKE